MELRRWSDQWHRMPLPRAQRQAPEVRSFAQRFLPEHAAPLPDLGPAAVADQLAVVVYDTSLEQNVDGLADGLRALRAELR